MNTVPQTTASRYPDYHQMAEQDAIESTNADQRRFAPMTAPPTKHYTAPDYPRVLLGQRTIADAQRQVEDDAGGLVAFMMNRGR
jgi:hypothetical protein